MYGIENVFLLWPNNSCRKEFGFHCQRDPVNPGTNAETT